MKVGGVWSPEERYPGHEISFSYLTRQGFILRLLLIAHNAKNCDHGPGLQEPSQQNDRNPLGKFFASIFIFYESLMSPIETSSNYFKLALLEKIYIPLRIQLKMKRTSAWCCQGAFPG